MERRELLKSLVSLTAIPIIAKTPSGEPINGLAHELQPGHKYLFVINGRDHCDLADISHALGDMGIEGTIFAALEGVDEWCRIYDLTGNPPNS
jgi:hypothetical protein